MIQLLTFTEIISLRITKQTLHSSLCLHTVQNGGNCLVIYAILKEIFNYERLYSKIVSFCATWCINFFGEK